LLWPSRATTKISLAVPRYPLAVPVGWGFLKGWDLLPELTHYCTIFLRKKTPKRITRSTLLPIIKKYKKANKIKWVKWNAKRSKRGCTPRKLPKSKY